MRTEEDHIELADNPFGLDDEVEGSNTIGKDNKFEDVVLGNEGNGASEMNLEVEDVETAFNASDEDEFSDWEMIEYEEAALALSVSKRAPDFMNDPFKDRWNNTVDAYTKKSIFGKRKTYALKPMMVKANDDCRQEVMALQLIKRLQ